MEANVFEPEIFSISANEVWSGMTAIMWEMQNRGGARQAWAKVETVVVVASPSLSQTAYVWRRSTAGP